MKTECGCGQRTRENIEILHGFPHFLEHSPNSLCSPPGHCSLCLGSSALVMHTAKAGVAVVQSCWCAMEKAKTWVINWETQAGATHPCPSAGLGTEALGPA